MLSAFQFLLPIRINALADVDFSLENAKSTYNIGEEISISAKITNKASYEKEFQILPVLISEQSNNEEAERQFISITIKPNETKTVSVYKVKVDKTFKISNYVLKVQLFSNYSVLDSYDIAFKVSNNNNVELEKPIIDFEVDLCSDENCNNSQKTFTLGNSIFLKTTSSINDVSYASSIINPGKQDKIEFPKNGYLPLEVGTYTIEVVASKNGYVSNSKTEVISIIEETVQPLTESVCKVDDFCAEGEDVNNCPQDCNPKPINQNVYFTGFIIVSTILLLILTIIFVIRLRKKFKK